MDDRRVVELRAADTHDLRLRVLRDGTPSAEIEWAGDDLDSTIHLGIIDTTGHPVAISTWLRTVSPDVSTADSTGYQLRGMATDPSPMLRGTGLGAALLDGGLTAMRERGADHVWANARTAVLGFYTRARFEIVSDQFMSEATAIPHRRILRHFD